MWIAFESPLLPEPEVKPPLVAICLVDWLGLLYLNWGRTTVYILKVPGRRFGVKILHMGFGGRSLESLGGFCGRMRGSKAFGYLCAFDSIFLNLA